ncbi:hypothetical protein CXB51_002169 [Gossypium anomalum]|uniref:RNase H type-1 domain-containing protein n=1 Tax=Gossypium anomalum TaxID=47600 RepID=A0A8J5Z7V7_9ROSI|nr:hypothetical protein CXB51_002169 [Gossypium anomalum]
MKIGFSLATRKDALWVRVLRSKYSWKSQLPISIHRSNCSHLWRSLSKVWPLFVRILYGQLAMALQSVDGLILGYLSAYWALKENSWGPKDDIWKLIWKYQGPHKRLFTNFERVRRGIGQSNACPQCGHDTEDIMHVPRDCLTSKEVWKLVVPPEMQASWAQHFEIFLFGSKDRSSSSIIHHHFSHDWMHLFIDGAVVRASGNASASGVVRDRDGNWILGFTHYLGRCSHLEAELWGILDGVLILLNKGYKRVKIQTDNLEVVKALNMEDNMDSGITLIKRLK